MNEHEVLINNSGIKIEIKNDIGKFFNIIRDSIHIEAKIGQK